MDAAHRGASASAAPAAAAPAPAQHVGPLGDGALDGADAADVGLTDESVLRPAAEQPDDTEIVTVQAGDVLTVQASAAGAVEVVVASGDGSVVAREAGAVVRLRHVATAAGVLAVRAHAPGAIGLRATERSTQLMVAVEPAGSAESTSEDGAAYLNARQHLLLNLFGVTPPRGSSGLARC